MLVVKTGVLGHRGGRGQGWPAENSLAAFDRAKREGADGCEFDVRPCSSGELVVFHDPDLARATLGNDARRVEDVPWSELQKIPLYGTNEKIPLLDEALALGSQVDFVLNVELKYDVRHRLGFAAKAAKILSAHRGKLIVSSFDPRILLACRLFGLRAPIAWLTHPTQRGSSFFIFALAQAPLFDGVHLERRQATQERIARLLGRGVFVGVWTVNDPVEARRLATMGVRWIITDEPGAVCASLNAS